MAANLAFLTLTVLLYSRIVFSTPAFHFSNTTMTPFSTSTSTSFPIATANISSSATGAVALDPTVTNCFITLPDNALTAEGLATPFLLMPPCSMTVGTQQAFAEAAVFDPATGDISIYHPLIIDAGKTSAVAPVVPSIPAGASVGLWFGFNGDTLQLLDTKGQDTNTSPILAAFRCINGEPGVKGDIFGQVSWCNTDAFFQSATASIASGKTAVPPLGTDHNGQDCPSSRSFTVVDQDPSDNLPTQYLLLPDGSTVQDTASNRAKFPDATVINNASDEALIGDIIDPLIGCTPFKVNSLDDPGTKVSSLATQELQAGQFQKTPLALVPIGDPDCLLTASGSISTSKTNNYRIGVNQPLLGAANSDNGDTLTFCNNMVEFAPPWLLSHQSVFIGQTTPDPGVGNNLFTFLCNRYLQSFTNLACTPTLTQTVACQLDSNGAAISCTIAASAQTSGRGGTGANSTASGTSSQPTTMLTTTRSSSITGGAGGSKLSSSVALTLSSSIGGLRASSTEKTQGSKASALSSLNEATVTISATSVPVQSANPCSTFSYRFPRHHHHGGFLGHGFNPVTVTHATGTAITGFGTTTNEAAATATFAVSSQDLSVAIAAASSIAGPTGIGQMTPLPAGSSALEATGAGAPTSMWLPNSSGTPSFVTITMTVYTTAGAACVPSKQIIDEWMRK